MSLAVMIHCGEILVANPMKYIVYICGLCWAIQGTYQLSVTNVALGKNARQSSTHIDGRGRNFSANKAIDNNTSPALHDKDKAGSCSRTDKTKDPHWFVDLHDEYMIERVQVYGRDQCCDGVNGSTIAVGYSNPTETLSWPNSELCGTVGRVPLPGSYTVRCNRTIGGRYVRIFLAHQGAGTYLTLCEVKVYGYLNRTGKATAMTLITGVQGSKNSIAPSETAMTSVPPMGSPVSTTLIAAIAGGAALVVITVIIVVVVVCRKRRKKSTAAENPHEDTGRLQAQANVLKDAEDGYSSAENLDIIWKQSPAKDAKQNVAVQPDQNANTPFSEADYSQNYKVGTDEPTSNIADLYAKPNKKNKSKEIDNADGYSSADELKVNWPEQNKNTKATPGIQAADTLYADVDRNDRNVEIPNSDKPENDISALYAMPDKTKKTKKNNQADNGDKTKLSKRSSPSTSTESPYDNTRGTSLSPDAEETVYYNTGPILRNNSTEDTVPDTNIYANSYK